MEKEEKAKGIKVPEIFPRIRPILREGEAIILLDDGDGKKKVDSLDKEYKWWRRTRYKRLIVLNRGDDIQIEGKRGEAGYATKWAFFLEYLICLSGYALAIILLIWLSKWAIGLG